MISGTCELLEPLTRLLIFMKIHFFAWEFIIQTLEGIAAVKSKFIHFLPFRHVQAPGRTLPTRTFERSRQRPPFPSPGDLPCELGPWGPEPELQPGLRSLTCVPRARALFKDAVQASSLDPCLGVM